MEGVLNMVSEEGTPLRFFLVRLGYIMTVIIAFKSRLSVRLSSFVILLLNFQVVNSVRLIQPYERI